MNLVRNHIIYVKRKMEELEYYPEIYYRDTPPETHNNYMARVDEIRKNARKSLEIYKADKDYQYILQNARRLDEKQEKAICLNAVLGYVSGLETFIERESYVEMRRHENPKGYLESFRECRKKMESLLEQPKEEKVGQLDIFDFIS